MVLLSSNSSHKMQYISTTSPIGKFNIAEYLNNYNGLSCTERPMVIEFSCIQHHYVTAIDIDHETQECFLSL